RDVPRECRLLAGYAAEVVLLRRLVADECQVRPDRAATAIDRVAGAAAFVSNELLREIDEVRSRCLPVVAMADVAVHLHQRAFVVDERIRLPERRAQHRFFPVLDWTVCRIEVHRPTLTAVARAASEGLWRV